ncbi:MAG TPA: hypothetical protein DF480_00080 [Clostridiales bacterium]|nr:hypothetical protein [Clostridiales bacterium]
MGILPAPFNAERKGMTVSRSKVILGILTVFVAVAAFLGYNAYKAFFGGVDSDYKYQISREMETITGVILSELNPKEEVPEAPVPEPESGSPEASPVQPAPASPEPIVPDPVRIQAVIDSYEGGFAKLQDQGNSVINGLIADAKTEYDALKESGAGKTAILNLAVSYMGKATAMENEIDAGFNALVSGLTGELEAAGMAEAEINAYIAKLKTTYKTEKDGRRNALLDRAKSYL